MAVLLPRLLRNFRSKLHLPNKFQIRWEGGEECPCKKGLVLGCYCCPDSGELKLTPTASKFNAQVGGKVEEHMRMTFCKGKHLHKGMTTTLQLDAEFQSVVVAGVGRPNPGYNPLENLDECKENVRIAAAAGARALLRQNVKMMCVEAMGSAEAAAEGVTLGLWRNQECLGKSKRVHVPEVSLYAEEGDREEWDRGVFKAEAQNIARKLSDMAANLMTPPVFAQHAVDLLCPCGVGVDVFDRDWAELNKFRLFLHVAKGSCEPPVVLKLSYCGGMNDEKPIVLVGSGVTFDAGGLCLKPCKRMSLYRADMAGAAVVVAVVRAAAALCMPINISAIIPLCENLPSGMAMRPGDIVKTMTDKTVVIDDTDNEGRLLLADALAFSVHHFHPRLLIDVGTLTKGMVNAIGASASGAYTNSNEMWKELNRAGAISGDRVWRFPLWRFFTNKVTRIRQADLCNRGVGPGGGPCRAAAFLQEFVECLDWVHLDIAGSGMMAESEEFSYHPRFLMTGRPVRLLIQFLYQIACPGKGSD